jgi:sulfur-carrier protein
MEKSITVKIKTLLEFKRILGARDISLEIPEGTTVKQLLKIMMEEWGEELAEALFKPDSQEPVGHIQLIINGRNIKFLDNLDTILGNEDVFLIFPPAGGG